ncbi:MAG: hypothetical protein JXA30_14700 [Deltaproteobacteria bacterium]|nr:hypothetical protein [Deltaproteobacteria bacterium]
MNRVITILFIFVSLTTTFCSNAGTEGPTVAETDVGTESGNPKKTFGDIPCAEDAQCEGVFDQQAEDDDAVVRTVQCNPNTDTCRAVLAVEEKCYVNQVIDSRAYDCSLTDEEIFELSESESN